MHLTLEKAAGKRTLQDRRLAVSPLVVLAIPVTSAYPDLHPTGRLAFKIAVISLAALPTILLLLSWSPVHSSSKCRDFPEVHYESPGQTSLVEDLQTTGSQTSRARWYQTNWKRQRADPSAKAPEPLDFCIFENLCVDGRASATDEAPYYLLGDTASDASDSEAFKQIFRRCFKASYRKRESYGIRPASTHEGASVQWVKGNTFGFMKDEAGNHPAAWGREWAAFLPTMIHGGGILQQEGVGGNQFFDHVQVSTASKASLCRCVR